MYVCGGPSAASSLPYAASVLFYHFLFVDVKFKVQGLWYGGLEDLSAYVVNWPQIWSD